MDRDNPPCTLHHELLEERRCHDVVTGANVRVWVHEGAAEETCHDDGGPTTDGLREISHEGTTENSAEVGNDLCYGHAVGRELELGLQECWVKILGAVGLLSLVTCHKWRIGVRVTMKLNPAMRRTRYTSVSQYFFAPALASLMKTCATPSSSTSLRSA